MAARLARTLATTILALFALAACGDDAPVAPQPGAMRPAGLHFVGADDDGAVVRTLASDGAGGSGSVARVEIVPGYATMVYDAPTQRMARELTAVAYDERGNVVEGREVAWRDETNWNPGVTLERISPGTARVALPYASAAAPVSADGACVLAWKGVAATVDGVTAVAPVCGTFHVVVSAEPGGFLPVTGDTIRLGASQLCRIRAEATGGHGTYDYRWALDGRDVGGEPTVRILTGDRNATHTLALRVTDEGHDVNPYRELRFTVRVDGNDDAAYDC